jgi:hypothetical protein
MITKLLKQVAAKGMARSGAMRTRRDKMIEKAERRANKVDSKLDNIFLSRSINVNIRRDQKTK